MRANLGGNTLCATVPGLVSWPKTVKPPRLSFNARSRTSFFREKTAGGRHAKMPSPCCRFSPRLV